MGRAVPADLSDLGDGGANANDDRLGARAGADRENHAGLGGARTRDGRLMDGEPARGFARDRRGRRRPRGAEGCADRLLLHGSRARAAMAEARLRRVDRDRVRHRRGMPSAAARRAAAHRLTRRAAPACARAR
ncbi:hypothetical protein BMAA1162 [Burkholderia mallei ATCC 23344]|uniref:Uncharacterized protein n=1 Tax=Burkholderia mallei (strain ATCC 23344) TaxID=243160 RepID=A0A0H2XDQ9_BURMA|nr:hypothetical protein BMAA1162 [Burkholderia mallei ATCC 23344]